MKNARATVGIILFCIVLLFSLAAAIGACATTPQLTERQRQYNDFIERDAKDAAEDAADLADCFQRGVIPEGYRQ